MVRWEYGEWTGRRVGEVMAKEENCDVMMSTLGDSDKNSVATEEDMGMVVENSK